MDIHAAAERMNAIAAKVLALAKSNDALPAKVAEWIAIGNRISEETNEWIREGGELAKAITSVSRSILIEHGRINDLRDAIEAMDDLDDGEAWKRA